MKIIHVEDYFDPTAGYQINELLYASKDSGDEVILITSNDMTPFHKKVDENLDKSFEMETGVKIVRLKSVFKISTRLILKNLKKTIKDFKPDIVFMHGIGDFKDLQLWSSKKNYVIVRDCHMSWVASKNKFRNIYYFFYSILFAPIINKTDKYKVVYALGIEEYEYLKKIGLKDHKLDYLYHGYNDSVIYYNKEERVSIRNGYGFYDDDIVISYIGKFNYSKRPDLIIDIVNRLDKEILDNVNLKILFIGSKDHDFMDDINTKLNNMNEKVEIIINDSKPFNELRKYYSASDICIFPKETTLSSIHAQICGCPVIMENHKSNKERVINNKNLYDIDDLDMAAEILSRIIKHKEYVKRDFNNNLVTLEEREYKKQIVKLKNIIG